MKRIQLVTWRTVEATAAFLFWLQATRVVFSVLFGVIYDALIDAELSFLVVGAIVAFLLAALLAPAVAPRRSRARSFTYILVALIARIPLTVNDPWLRLAAGVVIVGSAGVYLALLLRRRAELFPVALVLALLVDQIARAYGDTWDATLQPGFFPFQVVLCLGLLGVAWTLVDRPGQEDGLKGRLGWGGGLAIGGLLFLETAALAHPNVLARWSDCPYEWAAPALLVVTGLPLLPVAAGRLGCFGGRPAKMLAGWGVVWRAGLLAGGTLLGLIVGRRLDGALALVAFLLAQLLLLAALPLLLAPPTLNGRERSGAALALGMACFFVLHLAFAFAFTYADTIPAFRGAGLTVLLIGAGLTLLPAAFRPPDPAPLEAAPVNTQVLGLLAAAVVAVALWSAPDPLPLRESASSFRAATYNIHYGYDSYWRYTLEEQAQAIESSGADVVFLQEVDAGRITSYGVDNALWLARRLQMRAVFAPTLEGLSGIALLTRLPLQQSDWALLPSELEQTAIVHGRLGLEGKAVDAYGVWLGLDPAERMNQVRAALDIIGGAKLALLGGDMNSEPGSPVYAAVQAAGFSDPFVVTGSLPASTDPAVHPSRRVDFVWVRGLEPVAAEVSTSLASGHRLVVVEAAAP